MANNTSESLPKIKEVRAFVKKASGGDQGSLINYKTETPELRGAEIVDHIVLQSNALQVLTVTM